MTVDGIPGSPSDPITYRLARDGDLDTCLEVWRLAVNDYQGRLGQPPLTDDTGSLRRLLAHTLATDPNRFWVGIGRERAGRAAGAGASSGARAEIVQGFASATVREGLWFLAMLFVRPGMQAHGIGTSLMDHAQAGREVDPGGPAVPGPDDPLETGINTWGMSTDAAQPISNAIYARRGIVPRLPAWRLLGEVRRWSALPTLPASLEATPFDALGGDGTAGHERLIGIVNDLDRELTGSAHPVDHEYLRRDGRSGILVRERASKRAIGYVYGSGAGRLGPVAALDPDLHPALIGTAIRETPALGTVALWVPSAADRAIRGLLDAGLHFEGFPGLICWSRPEHPFARYIPISLALV